MLFLVFSDVLFFFFKQKTAYEMRISDWSSDVCSSDLDRGEHRVGQQHLVAHPRGGRAVEVAVRRDPVAVLARTRALVEQRVVAQLVPARGRGAPFVEPRAQRVGRQRQVETRVEAVPVARGDGVRSEEHTSELKSLMRTSDAVFCLKKKNTYTQNPTK